jgi:hypothetical protein
VGCGHSAHTDRLGLRLGVCGCEHSAYTDGSGLRLGICGCGHSARTDGSGLIRLEICGVRPHSKFNIKVRGVWV